MMTTTATRYETVIGLEVHVQLNTASKLFCPCPNHFGDAPNTNTCPVCLGLPGTLPVPNQQAITAAIMIGLALNCQIAEKTRFDRKQYFYPDLPKGYQISQSELPICGPGYLMLGNGKKAGITRAHLEEDAGKLVHVGAAGLAGADYSLVDLNRAGTPLVEIVGEPDLCSADEARDYLTQLRQIVRYLGVCDGNMEEGSMRCDANISLRPVGQAAFGTKTEIKNMNSFKAVQRAIDSEIARQTDMLDRGKRIKQESRLWDEATGTTRTMRSKEDAHDYRFFPEPDIKPFTVPADLLAHIKATLPELPEARMHKLQQQFELSEYDANVLTEFKELGDMFVQATEHTTEYKGLANWLMGDMTGWLKQQKLTLANVKLTAEELASFVNLVANNTLSSAQAKKLLPDLLQQGGDPAAMAKTKGLVQLNDDAALQTIIEGIIANNPKNVADYRAGKDKLFGFFVGQAMKATQGNANPEKLNQLLKDALQG
jgi:aspartyl-tRNA(Asn)/glutamyl-tRNA(Gln) amidotransferase subunit B